jgi:lipoprotein-releasing system permease protein
MRMNVNTQIALTYLLSRKKQTLIAALGVMFGISMFILLQSMMKGTNDYFEQQSFSTTPHVRLYSESKLADDHMLQQLIKDNSVKILVNPKQIKQNQGIINPYGIIDNIRKNPNVTAVTPQVSANVIYTSGSITVTGTVAGVNIMEENKMFNLQQYMLTGDLNAMNSVTNGIVVGKGIADKLSLHVGDNITVRAGFGDQQTMKVVGIYATTIKQVDETKSYANIAQAQKLLGKDRSYVTDIKINVADYQQASAIAVDFERIAGYRAEDWVKTNESLKVAFKIRAIILNSVIGVLLLVAGFGIYNILNMTIYEKIKEIAILKATGFSGGAVVSIFLQQAFYIGVMGAVIGVALGFGITLAVSRIYIGGGFLKYLPMSFYLPHYVQAVLFGVITTVAAGYFPARKASQVDPVSIIRG